jgi:hypothetical protein
VFFGKDGDRSGVDVCALRCADRRGKWENELTQHVSHEFLREKMSFDAPALFSFSAIIQRLIEHTLPFTCNERKQPKKGHLLLICQMEL